VTIIWNVRSPKTYNVQESLCFFFVGGDIAVILLITSVEIWQCPSCHLIPKNWISRADLLTLLLFMQNQFSEEC